MNDLRNDTQSGAGLGQGKACVEKAVMMRKRKGERGCHECQVFGPGPEAAESDYAWKNCTKTPGHAHFIPVSHFNREHLPPTHQGEDVLNRIRNLCDLTVRLRVRYVSCHRPDGYPFSGMRGRKVPRYGSGCVKNVSVGTGPCPCPACVDSSSVARQRWFRVCVHTACHVVYNAEEAAFTDVDFFYDDETSMAEGRGKTLSGWRVLSTEKNNDNCVILCATHDITLAEGLREALTTGRFQTMFPMMHEDGFHPDPAPSGDEEIVVVVPSHPHGQTKKVTVGRFASGRSYYKEVYEWCEYTTHTCPGSSGAPVLGLRTASRGYTLTAHSGYNVEDDVNQSAATSFPKYVDNRDDESGVGFSRRLKTPEDDDTDEDESDTEFSTSWRRPAVKFYISDDDVSDIAFFLKENYKS